jgi:hypothetical protein
MCIAHYATDTTLQTQLNMCIARHTTDKTANRYVTLLYFNKLFQIQLWLRRWMRLLFQTTFFLRSVFLLLKVSTRWKVKINLNIKTIQIKIKPIPLYFQLTHFVKTNVPQISRQFSWPIRVQTFQCSWFLASATVQKISSLFWDVTQRRHCITSQKIEDLFFDVLFFVIPSF